MDLSTQIDIYCERLGPGFWAEPVNAISNLSFLAAALWGFWLARRRREGDLGVYLLIVLAAAVGVGSFLFHTFATRWAGMADVIPILLFMALGAYVAGRRLLGASVLGVVLGGAAIAGAVWGLSEVLPLRLPSWNGSSRYAPAVLILAGFAAVLAVLWHPAAATVAAAAGTLLVSLVFRTIDARLCADFPLGTHVFWHLLNGV
ncbi:MAG: ceramidase domain-containing protein, partial [Alphaproteobacteria bacterium]